MVKFLTDEANTQFYLGGASFLNESLDNFVYKLRYSYSPRNSGEKGYFLIPSYFPNENIIKKFWL